MHPGGDVDAWRNFLLLLGRSPEAVRADGGIARVWTTMAGRHVELREIDYAEVLRERSGGEAAVWERVIANCLQGDAFELDEEAIEELLGIVGDSRASSRADGDARAARRAAAAASARKTAALMRMLRGIVDAVVERAIRIGSSRCCATWRRRSASCRPTCCSACSAASQPGTTTGRRLDAARSSAA